MAGEHDLEWAAGILNENAWIGSEWHVEHKPGLGRYLVLHPDDIAISADKAMKIASRLLAERLEREAKDKAVEMAIAAMGDAVRDILEWRQLGRRWQDESADYSRDPMCPTDAGMERSEVVLRRLATARAALRECGIDTSNEEE